MINSGGTVIIRRNINGQLEKANFENVMQALGAYIILICRVPKLFLSELSPESQAQDMKLNRRKIHGIIRQKQEGVSSREIAKDVEISCRRVDQIWKYFRDHGHEPIIGNDVGRPRKPYDEVEARIVRDAHQRFRFGARMLRSSSIRCIMLGFLIIGSICTFWLRDFQFEIQRNRSAGNGSDMNVNIACQPDISIGTKMSGQA